MTPAQHIRDVMAARSAQRIYAEAHDRLAEVQQVEVAAGHPLSARKFAFRAEIARRAYVAEVNDPEPVNDHPHTLAIPGCARCEA